LKLDPTTMTQTFTIQIGNLPKLQKLVNRINKRAEKNGVSGVAVTVLENTKRLEDAILIKSDIDPWLDVTTRVIVIDVEVNGDLPVVNGYSYVASVERTDNGNLVTGGDGVDLSKFRNSDLTCDHCNTTRNRKKTIIVKDSDGNLLQVGRSCVKDFLGVNFESELKGLESLFVYFRDSDGGDNTTNGSVGFPIEGFLARTAAEIRAHGWLSSGSAWENGGISTKDVVLISYDPRKKGQVIEVEDEDIETAKKAFEWVLSVDPDSDFLHNIQVVAKNGFVTYKTAGFASAIVFGYQKDNEKLIRKGVDFSKSEFVGSVGTRITIKVKVLSKKVVNSFYGDSTLITFVTPDGNIINTFASGSISEVPVDEELTIKGTVKKHNVYRENKQTVLNRVAAV
jgi:hypothetical protein